MVYSYNAPRREGPESHADSKDCPSPLFFEAKALLPWSSSSSRVAGYRHEGMQNDSFPQQSLDVVWEARTL